MRFIFRVLTLFTLLAAGAGAYLFLAYGGGQAYDDVTGVSLLPPSALEEVVSFDRPIGNAAVSAGGRIFFTIHPESRPEGSKLYEWIEGVARPFPIEELQEQLFIAPLGVAIDRFNRLWVIDHGDHGFRQARLLAFDVASGELVHSHYFPDDVAPLGSMLQDLQVSPDGLYVYIADASFWRRDPALVVYDVQRGFGRRVLSGHESVRPKNYVVRTPERAMRFFFGVMDLRAGVDGLAVSEDGRWLAYGAMNSGVLYQVDTNALINAKLSEEDVAAAVDTIGRKPLSDGMSADAEGGVLVTDVEHGAVLRVAADGALETIIKDGRVRWADSLSFGPDGNAYLADSALPHVLLRSSDHMAEAGPYKIYRFKPPVAGAPGQ